MSTVNLAHSTHADSFQNSVMRQRLATHDEIPRFLILTPNMMVKVMKKRGFPEKDRCWRFRSAPGSSSPSIGSGFGPVVHGKHRSVGNHQPHQGLLSSEGPQALRS